MPSLTWKSWALSPIFQPCSVLPSNRLTKPSSDVCANDGSLLDSKLRATRPNPAVSLNDFKLKVSLDMASCPDNQRLNRDSSITVRSLPELKRACQGGNQAEPS